MESLYKSLEGIDLVLLTNKKWQLFKWEINWVINGLPDATSDKQKIAIFMTEAGNETMELFDILESTEKSTYTEVIEAFDKVGRT